MADVLPEGIQPHLNGCENQNTILVMVVLV